METRVGVAIDAIVAALEPALTAINVNTWDGPCLTGDYSDAVYVGYDADPEGLVPAANVTQSWAGLGQRKRNEDIQITCAIVVTVGDNLTTWKPVRDKLFTILDTVGQLLRTDGVLGPSLGLSAPSVAELWPGQLFQEGDESGYQARLVFTINYITRV